MRSKRPENGGAAEVESKALAFSRMICSHCGNFLLALFEVAVRDRLEIVDVIEVNVLQEIHLRIDVARDGDIDEKQRTAAARYSSAVRVWRDPGCNAGAEVLLITMSILPNSRRPIVKSNGAAAERLGQRDRPLVRPIATPALNARPGSAMPSRSFRWCPLPR